MFKVNNGDASERCHCCRQGVIIVNFEQIFDLILMTLLLIWTGKCRLENDLVIFKGFIRFKFMPRILKTFSQKNPCVNFLIWVNYKKFFVF